MYRKNTSLREPIVATANRPYPNGSQTMARCFFFPNRQFSLPIRRRRLRSIMHNHRRAFCATLSRYVIIIIIIIIIIVVASYITLQTHTHYAATQYDVSYLYGIYRKSAGCTRIIFGHCDKILIFRDTFTEH
jgi:hypothetical protein